MTAVAGTVTPVGDWIRQRYPPNDGATHYLGADGDPGCCAGPHPACTYDAAFREGRATEREHLIALMDAEAKRLTSLGHPQHGSALTNFAALIGKPS